MNKNTNSSLLLSWNDYYTNIITIDQKLEDEEFSFLNTNIQPALGDTYVFNCYFHDMSDENGGAIFFQNKNKNLLLEQCSFLYCNAKTDTAAVRSLTGNVVIAFTCGQYNKAEKNDGFSAVHSDTTRTINSVYDSSISHSEATTSHTMYHSYGQLNIKTVNISHNSANKISSLKCVPSTSSKTIDICFCSFSNNTSKEQCIQLNNENNIECQHQIKNSNFIQNKGKDTFYSKGETNIVQCCILGNGDPCFFAETNSQITLINCSTDQTNYVGSFIKIETTNPFIIALTFYETGNCHNLFIHYPNTFKCRTLLQKNIFLHKMILNCLFIFILSL